MKLQVWLKENKIKQKVFADRLGVTPMTVCRWVKGKVLPSQKTISEIVKITAGSDQPNDFYSEV